MALFQKLKNTDNSVFLGVFFWLVLLIYTFFNEKMPSKSFYDELYHIRNIALLQQNGFSTVFFRDYDATPGPLYTLIQYLFLPLTGSNIALLRCVNVLLLLLLIAVTQRLIVYLNEKENTSIAWAYLFLPTMYLLGGLVLTELPAMICMTLFVSAALKMLEHTEIQKKCFSMLLAGVFLGLGIIGRQAFLAILPFLFVLIFLNKNYVQNFKWLVGVQCIAFCVYFPLFYEWGALLAPKYQNLVSSKPEVFRSLLALCYSGIFIFIIAPKWFLIFPKKWILPSLLLSLVLFFANYGLQIHSFIPNKALVWSLFQEKSELLGYLFSVCSVTISLMLLYCVFQNWYANENKVLNGFWYLCFLTTATSCIFFDKFGSRYVLQAVPFLLPVLQHFTSDSKINTFVKVASAVLGLISLHLTL